MTKREQVINYIRNGGERLVCSPQIGGAGYDTKLAGKEWCSEGRMEYTVEACNRYQMLPIYNVGLDPTMHSEKLHWVCDGEEKLTGPDRIVREYHLDTPYGTMHRRSEERPHSGGFNTVDAINGAEDFDMLEYVIDTALAEEDFSCYTKWGKEVSDFYGDDGPVSVQWCMQPYEMLGFPNTVTTVMLAMDDEERFFRLMDKILELDCKIIDALAPTGIDFVFLGGPGSELISPTYYEKYLVPYSKKVTDYAHSKGLLIYSHICSPIEPMLSKGYYNQMGIDLFETLSPQPEGNIISIADAFSKLDPKICTRGNVSMSLLMQGTPEEIKQSVFEIMDAAHAQGRKHMVGASDCLLYETPEENVKAICDAFEEYYNRKG